MTTPEQQPIPGTSTHEDANASNASGVLVSTRELRIAIRAAMDEIDLLDEKRSELNAQKQAVRKRLKAKGICLKAFDVETPASAHEG